MELLVADLIAVVSAILPNLSQVADSPEKANYVCVVVIAPSDTNSKFRRFIILLPGIEVSAGQPEAEEFQPAAQINLWQ